MLKKSFLFLVFLSSFYFSFSQDDEQAERGRFDWNKVFVGGNLVLGYGASSYSSQFTIGGYPEIGYSIFKMVDVGLGFNVIYQSGSEYQSRINRNVDYTIFNFGMGIFTRVHITDGFFIHAQPEFNNIKYKASASGIPGLDTTLKSTSTLLGVGWGTRDVGNTNFFTLILIDLSNNLYSPYRTSYGAIIPQIRFGFNWYLGRGKKRR